jgi:exoribonuclease R
LLCVASNASQGFSCACFIDNEIRCLDCTVSNLTDYGAFVRIEEGVEGLVHVSEMDWTNA